MELESLLRRTSEGGASVADINTFKVSLARKKDLFVQALTSVLAFQKLLLIKTQIDHAESNMDSGASMADLVSERDALVQVCSPPLRGTEAASWLRNEAESWKRLRLICES